MTLVSIIIPARNAEKYIVDTLTSITDQSHQDLEVIVVDDCSSDNTAKLLKEFKDSRIRVIKGNGKGISSALNLALESSNGSLILRCDADDLYTPNRVTRQVQWLAENNDAIAICGDYQMISEGGIALHERAVSKFEVEANISDELRHGITRTSFCTFATRASAIKQLGGFRPYFETAEDIDLMLRLGSIGRIGYLPEIEYRYRIHENSVTHSAPDNRRIYFEATAREYANQRRLSGQDALQLGTQTTVPVGKSKRHSAIDHALGIAIGTSWYYYDRGQRGRAIRTAVLSLRLQPHKLAPWKNLAILLAKIISKGNRAIQ